MKRTCTLTIEVEYDDEITDPESLASAADILLETAVSTPGILDDYGNPKFESFYPQANESGFALQRVVAACDDASFRGELLRALAGVTAKRVFKPNALADPHDSLAFAHQALGILLSQDYAHYDASIICEVAAAALEDANFHSEAQVVRELAFD
jgi:hypothetical protein